MIIKKYADYLMNIELIVPPTYQEANSKYGIFIATWRNITEIPRTHKLCHGLDLSTFEI